MPVHWVLHQGCFQEAEHKSFCLVWKSHIDLDSISSNIEIYHLNGVNGRFILPRDEKNFIVVTFQNGCIRSLPFSLPHAVIYLQAWLVLKFVCKVVFATDVAIPEVHDFPAAFLHFNCLILYLGVRRTLFLTLKSRDYLMSQDSSS